ncbi:MAG: cysteine desulfurase [Rhodospirillales bacterium]|nr:cysteine desulfurase [Rhodospirillales bacterium]
MVDHASHHSAAEAPLDVAQVRRDFPILAETVHGQPLVYLDTAASAQKPRAVIEAMQAVYERGYANVHRAVHCLGALATDAYEAARDDVARFINAESADQIVFTRNATEAINLVASSYGRAALAPGDEIVLSEMEHHANIVPWQMLRHERGIVLRIAPIDDDGALRLDAFADLLGERTRLVAITHCSNVLGAVTPIRHVIGLAHAAGARVLVDGSQAIVHRRVDVQDLEADFYVFTGHKLYGPTGIGVLYGKREALEAMPPYQGGGEMIERVSFDATIFKAPPHRFEAGTPPFVQAVGLAAAIRYLTSLGLDRIAAHERDLLAYATEKLVNIEGVRVFGTTPEKSPILSFAVGDVHPFDLATLLDRRGIAVRAGHHCAEPLMARLGITGVVRASFGVYNTRAEADALAAGVRAAMDALA